MERDVCDVNDSKLCGLSIGKVGDEEDKNVKTVCADGTAMQCGRVGSRLLLSRASDFERFLRLFCIFAA